MSRENQERYIDQNATDLFNKILSFFDGRLSQNLDHFQPQAFLRDQRVFHHGFNVAVDLGYYPEVFIESCINQESLQSGDTKAPFMKSEYKAAKSPIELGAILLYVPLLWITILIGTLLGHTSLPTPDTLWWPSHEWLLSYKLYISNLLLIPVLLAQLFGLDAQYYTCGFMAIFFMLMEKGFQSCFIGLAVTGGIYHLIGYLPQKTLDLQLVSVLRYIIPSCLFFYLFVVEASIVVTAILLALSVDYFKDLLRSGKLLRNGRPMTTYFKYWVVILYICAPLVHILPVYVMTTILLFPIISIYGIFFWLVKKDGE